MSDNIIVIIRTSGESTVNALQKNLSKLFGSDNVNLVSGGSFESVLTKSYQKAIQSQREWALIIDGDILPAYNFRYAIRKAIKSASANQLGFGFKVFDRFYGTPKYRGIHLYQVYLLPNAIKKIPGEGATLRPETFVKKKMREEGFGWEQMPITVGLHDFYQQPFDIFCKMLIRAHRSKKDVPFLFERFHKKIGQGKSDFKFALAGLQYGEVLKDEKVYNSRMVYKETFEKKFGLLNSEINIPSNLGMNLLFIFYFNRFKLQVLLSKIFRKINSLYQMLF